MIATDLDASKLTSLKTDKRYALDARSTPQVEALAKKVIGEFGAPDILVNCAGYVHQGCVLDCSEEDWDLSFDLNVKSMHRTLRAFLPAMLKNGGGSIVNISSAVSSIRGVPARYAYGATKAAVIGLTKAVAADYIRQGIRCNAICPGTIVSPSFEQRVVATAEISGQTLDKTLRGFHRAPAHRPARHHAGSRQSGAVSGVRRVELHHRPAASGRRRHGAVIVLWLASRRALTSLLPSGPTSIASDIDRPSIFHEPKVPLPSP